MTPGGVIGIEEGSNEKYNNAVSISYNTNIDISYQYPSILATQLYRTISNDKNVSRCVHSNLHEWIGKLRSGNRIGVHLNIATTAVQNNNVESNNIIPKPAIITPVNSQKRN